MNSKVRNVGNLSSNIDINIIAPIAPLYVLDLDSYL